MSVRYANFIGLSKEQRAVHVYCNRGTSGIDGCNSTAVGHALLDKRPNILITGDLAFFYDRNAFWHNYSVPNLKVVLLNNHGGIIFKLIDGPAALPEADEFFVTNQRLTAGKLCEEFKFEHVRLDNRKKLRNLLKDLLENTDGTKVLEFESPGSVNVTMFEELKMKMRKSYEL
jgi:2-succinyl-5-enolpyruvyl-6-hydroxy-3-cyclohexene-1-carboxylate synthase